MSAIQTTIGLQYEANDAEFAQTYADFRNLRTESLAGAMVSPYIEGHVLSFKKWVYVVATRRNGKSTIKTVAVFQDETANREVQIWLSYFAKQWRDVVVPAADHPMAKANPELWEATNSGTFGGEMGREVSKVVSSTMTNGELMTAAEAVMSANKWTVHRVKYTRAIQDQYGKLHVDKAAEYVEFNKVAALPPYTPHRIECVVPLLVSLPFLPKTATFFIYLLILTIMLKNIFASKNNGKSQVSNNVSIARTTLRALTASLYSEEGTNVQPIISDLTKGGSDSDLTALNVALLLTRPELCRFDDTAIRCTHNEMPKGYRYGTCVRVYEFADYSVLLDRVHYYARTFEVYDSSNESHPNSVQVCGIEEGYMSADEWHRLSTTFPKAFADHMGDEDDTYFAKEEESAE